MLSNSITGMFSSPSSVACVVHQNFSHSRRFRNTLCTDSVSPRVPSALAVGCCKLFRGCLAVTVFLVFLGLQGAFFSCSFATWLKPRSNLLLLMFTRALACFRVQDGSTVSREHRSRFQCRAGGFVMFWIAAASRMISSTPYGLKTVIAPVSAPTRHFTSTSSGELDMSLRTVASQKFTKHTDQRQLVLKFNHLHIVLDANETIIERSSAFTVDRRALRACVSLIMDVSSHMAKLNMSFLVYSPTP